jgi:hypothetical protein
MGVNESMHFEPDVFGNFLTYLLFIANYIDMKFFCTVESLTNALQQSIYLKNLSESIVCHSIYLYYVVYY